MTLLRRIEHYMKRTHTTATRFGRDAANDPYLVFEMRKGRKVGEKLTARVHAWLDRRGGRKTARKG
ncbi:MAG TPA: hypothetical protein VK614_00585 [Allosphingosinicella sp.]|nr:hypothetical protein [Allosphingosinicella sp.]